jgi:diaminopimelate dehydrogenase
MGHSDALRRVPGVRDARQFTHACPEAIKLVEEGGDPGIGEMHWRECFVAIEPGADEERIRAEIVTMEGYFAPYRTTVEFLSLEVLRERFKTMPHDGMVIARSPNGIMRLGVQWESNPEATARILLSSALAARRLNEGGQFGAFSSLDIAPAFLLPEGTNPFGLV